ncbi:NAD(P)-dependent oxidoreductase [Marinomonas ostreistagni]|uniref:NAD(P)-dependent oxidoreductase n=1 Tax=Marinomonas ostreistagni TaxID=359209 RepID=A0ABS0ZD63_9GAMM|nr:NAD(P)-dependent oxidoreductase [Marinomonas ostreistagni]MBJ7551612.1 NAD(P)-dependent oxidoreductase [Marinomonas ostreistagni]
MSKQQVAFLGLGVMGFPMAGHLAKAGYNVTVYNRTFSKAERWTEEYNGHAAKTPAEAVHNADIVCICVGNDNDVRSVVLGDDGVLAGVKANAIVIDHTTTSAVLAEELDKACETAGVHFMDAPVSGGQAGAENGVLTAMCGAQAAVFDTAAPVISSYAQKVERMGPVGQGQRCKMVNQICIAGILNGLSEALAVAQKADLDIRKVVDTLQHGAAGSWQMVNRMETMAKDEFDFGFAIDWMRKDLGICLDQAARYGLDLKMVKEVDQHYASLQQEGLGRMDTSVLVKAIIK